MMILKEITLNELKSQLREGVETKNMSAAKHYLYDKMHYDEKEAMKCIGMIKTDIPNSRMGKCKFMLGLVRMFCDGQLNDGYIIMGLNKTLKYIASDAHINEYNQNLNGLGAEELIKRFSGVAQSDLEKEMGETANMDYEGDSHYEIIRIDDFETASQYGGYVSWCVTHDENMYNSYTNDGFGVFYFCLRDGWQNEQQIKGENCPLDSYGLSMIAVSVNEDGSCNTITCRWNHDNGGNDNVMTPKELSNVINRDFYQVFKPYSKEELEMKKNEIFSTIEDEMWEAENYYGFQHMFEDSYDYIEDKAFIKKDVFCFYSEKYDKRVIVDKELNFVVDEILDRVGNRQEDIIDVSKGNFANFLRVDGRFLLDRWANVIVNYFRSGFGMVLMGKKFNLIDRDGNFLFDEWKNSMRVVVKDFSTDGKPRGVVEIPENGVKTSFKLIRLPEMTPIFEKTIVSEILIHTIDHEAFGGLRFEGDDFYQLYDRKTFKKLAPWKITEWTKGYLYKLDDGGEYGFNKNFDLCVLKNNGDGNTVWTVVKENPMKRS